VWVFCMNVMMYSCGQMVLFFVGILYECYDVHLWADGVVFLWVFCMNVMMYSCGQRVSVCVF
jgi:hypothetical protein